MALEPEKYSRTTMPQSRGKRIMMAREAVNMLATTTEGWGVRVGGVRMVDDAVDNVHR